MCAVSDLVPITCNNCGKKLGEAKLVDGIVSIKCTKCGTVNTQQTKPAKSGQTAKS